MAKQSDTVGIPKRLPLVVSPENRDDNTDKDARLVNCYAEKTEDGGFQLYKRPGMSEYPTYSEAGLVGRGMYNWRGDVYIVFGGGLYKNGTLIGAVNDSLFYTFSENLDTPPELFLHNTVGAYSWDNATLVDLEGTTTIPTSRVPGSAYLDGTTYVGTPAAELFGSGLDDLSLWDPLNLILARIEPDRGIAVAKQLVYVVFFKEWTTEVFYDAGNPTASPLGAVQGAKVGWGCVNARSIQQIDDTLLWLSNTRNAQVEVIMMSNLKAEVVSTPPVERLFDNVALTDVYSWSLKDEGHTFYVITSVQANLTMAYDLKEKLWWQWTDTGGNYVPIVASSFNLSREHLIQHATTGQVFAVDRVYTSDDGSVITVDIYTPNWDGGVDRRKTLNMMHILCDQQSAGGIRVRHNDNDYDPTRWSQWRTIDLSRKRPIISNLGTFERRAHNFRYEEDTKLRIKAVDLQLDLGTL